LFNILDKMHHKGSIRNWFAWIEALTLTAALYIAAIKTGAMVLYILAVISTVLAWWTAVRSLLDSLNHWLSSLPIPLWLKVLIQAPIAFVTPTVVFVLLAVALYGFIES